MAGWFDEEQNKKVKEKEEIKYIDEPFELGIYYEKTNEQLTLLTGEDYSRTIYPLLVELKGSEDAGTGNLGELKMKIIDSPRLAKSPVGQMVLQLIRDVKELIGWQSSYSSHLEKYTDSYKYVCVSAFRIIERVGKEMQEMERKLNLFENSMRPTMGDNGEKAEVLSPPLSKEEKEELRKKFEERYKKYVTARVNGGKHWLAKGDIIVLGQKNELKKGLLYRWFDEEERKRKSGTSTGKEEESPQSEQISSPVLQNQENENSVLNSDDKEGE